MGKKKPRIRPINAKEEIGKLVKEFRTAMDKTPKGFADMIGITTAHLVTIERARASYDNLVIFSEKFFALLRKRAIRPKKKRKSRR
jgi:hypothetical protein